MYTFKISILTIVLSVNRHGLKCDPCGTPFEIHSLIRLRVGSVCQILSVINWPSPAVTAALIVFLVMRMGNNLVACLVVLVSQKLLQSYDTGDQKGNLEMINQSVFIICNLCIRRKYKANYQYKTQDNDNCGN